VQRIAEIIVRVDVFKKLRLQIGTDAASLARFVESVGSCIGTYVKVMIVLRFVDTHSPENDRRVAPVTANHPRNIVDGYILPGLVADVLPAGDLFKHHKTEFIAGVQEVS